MSGNATDWVAEKIAASKELEIVRRTPENFLVVKANGRDPFIVAVLGKRDAVRRDDVAPLFAGKSKPDFVVNVPSTALWKGPAMLLIHAAPSAFGTLGDLVKAADKEDVSTYRNKTWEFFHRAISQHSNVTAVEPVNDKVFKAVRMKGKDLTIALTEAYNMGAEDVRNAHDLLGSFDVIVKTTSYGSVTSAADRAAESMGAEAVMFKGLLQRLAR